MNLLPLKWDSKFFNLKIGKINDTVSLNQTSPLLIKKYDLIYIEQLNNKNLTKKAAVLFNIEYTDKKIIYLKNLTDKISIDKNIFEYPLKSANKKITELAIQSGSYSRFRLDTNFPEAYYKKLYIRWINNSVKKKSADMVLIYGDIKNPVGFITLIFKDKLAQIGLIAVNEISQNKGVGKALIGAAEYFALKNNFTRLQVITQAENKKANFFYKKCDFKKDAIIFTHHHWNR